MNCAAAPRNVAFIGEAMVTPFPQVPSVRAAPLVTSGRLAKLALQSTNTWQESVQVCVFPIPRESSSKGHATKVMHIVVYTRGGTKEAPQIEGDQEIAQLESRLHHRH